MRPSTHQVDPEFLSLPLHRLADAALSRASALGAEHADVRVHRTQTQSLRLRDGAVQSANDASTIGLAVRVVVDGTWGFASHAELSAETAVATAEQAVGVARALRSLNRDPVVLAPEPRYTDAHWVSDYDIDPFTVPTA
ncbi:MAG: PmbA/TldA family metallopeptidase, partial [Mycobacteriaceae bacterium]